MNKKVFFDNGKGFKLAGVLSIPDKEGKFPAVIRLHGFRSGKDGSSSTVFDDKFKDDYIYLRFDFFAHGESEGEFEDLTPTEEFDDTKAAIDFVCGLEQCNGEVGLIGSSLGGMVAIYVTANDSRVKTAVFGAPVSDFKESYTEIEGDIEGWKKQGWKYTYNFEGQRFKIKYDFFEDGCKYDFYKEAEKISVPVLVIQGDLDESIPLEQSKKLMKHLKNAEFYVVKGAVHHWATQPEHFKVFVEKTVEFFRKNL
ncbi:MAG: alpha/beta hydrolase [Nanoarchaeota archaeon]|nr:alpha/beta hydrolase [Nanoarchaeota archaeon]